MPGLWAISDLHVAYDINRDLVHAIPAHPDDWLVVAGDVGESAAHLRWTWQSLSEKFSRLLWVPGNHELWTTREDPDLRGEEKYQHLVEICREFGVLTPEDPYPVADISGVRRRVAPLFLLYDYTFCPENVGPERAVSWAMEHGLKCADEFRIEPEPHQTIPGWCRERLKTTESRLASLGDDIPSILINHFPLRYEHVFLPRIPRFSIWCGTRETEDWHRRFNAEVVISGHLHMRRSLNDDGVRFEEVSIGYPRERQRKQMTPESALVPIF